MTRLYLGVDNTQPNAIRIVGVLTEDHFCWEATPLFSIRYTGRQPLERFWERVLGKVLPDAVAATALRHDPFSTLSWFEEQGVKVCRYGRYDLSWIGHFVHDEWHEVSQRYTRARTLGLRIAYQFEAAYIL